MIKLLVDSASDFTKAELNNRNIEFIPLGITLDNENYLEIVFVVNYLEYSNDQYGPIWPMSIAPYQVEVCALDINKPGVAEAAEKICAELEAAGVEVLYDDRGEKAGFVFSDADLIGIPLRIVVSPKTLAEEQVEFKRRGSRDAARLSVGEAAEFVAKEVKTELSKYQI